MAITPGYVETHNSPETLQHTQKDAFSNFAWVYINAYMLYSQSTGIRGGGINIGGNAANFRFIAPTEVMENIRHTWEEFESVASKIAGTAISLGQGIRAFKELSRSLQKAGIIGKNVIIGQEELSKLNPINLLRAAANISADYPFAKHDNPLVYMNSQRREVELSFRLVSEQGNPKKFVIDPIKRLQELSSPRLTGDAVNFSPPYVFTVKSSKNGEFLDMSYSALTSVQPTYREPYYKGYPTIADLSLTFTELSPLYSSLIQGSSVIRVNGE